MTAHLGNLDQSSNAIWRNDITGLRALAVIPVVLYHAFPSVIPGGGITGLISFS